MVACLIAPAILVGAALHAPAPNQRPAPPRAAQTAPPRLPPVPGGAAKRQATTAPPARIPDLRDPFVTRHPRSLRKTRMVILPDLTDPFARPRHRQRAKLARLPVVAPDLIDPFAPLEGKRVVCTRARNGAPLQRPGGVPRRRNCRLRRTALGSLQLLQVPADLLDPFSPPPAARRARRTSR